MAAAAMTSASLASKVIVRNQFQEYGFAASQLSNCPALAAGLLYTVVVYNRHWLMMALA
jgi:hypothetical protein